MQAIREVATITSKGQITLPKSIRQALGVDTGCRLAFDLIGGRVTVTRITDDLHEDPAIRSFLSLLENDIAAGRNIASLPASLVCSMRSAIDNQVDLEEEITGDVVL